MKVWRYKVREELRINAPVTRVYAIATDPSIVPSYAHEIHRIEVLERHSERSASVRSYLKIAGLSFPFSYKYRYRPPAHYTGVQQGSRTLRGSFSFTFREASDGATIVSHTEGITSSIPFVAHLAGFIYFRLLAPGGLREELERLKRLVESGLLESDAPGNNIAPERPLDPGAPHRLQSGEMFP
jgi:uncharacterized protein YndB with AHSA1/START domain